MPKQLFKLDTETTAVCPKCGHLVSFSIILCGTKRTLTRFCPRCMYGNVFEVQVADFPLEVYLVIPQ